MSKKVEINETFIPSELKALKQWVCHKEKVPVSSFIHKCKKHERQDECADPTDPDTWSTYQQAVDAFKKRNLDGIGFVFSKDDPYVGIDLDDCRDPKTGMIEAWALGVIEQINSYTEASPSGTGVHIIAKGDPLSCGQGGHGKHNNCEIYYANHYFTFTGDVIDEEHSFQ